MTDQTIVTGETRELPAALPVADVTNRYRQMAEFATGVMRSDVDYGVIPGTGKKPSLLKPGAEKLTVLFGLEARFALVDRVEDWANGFFFYRYECQLWHRESGRLVGNAYGSCNSRESKYRWRNVPEWKATAEDKKSAIRTETRTNNRGEYAVYIVPNAEPYDLVNTIDKMAQKRALVAAVLVGTGASEFFTQDMEDFAPEEAASSRRMEKKPEAPAPASNGHDAAPPPVLTHSADPAVFLADYQSALAAKGPMTSPVTKKQAGFLADLLRQCWPHLDGDAVDIMRRQACQSIMGHRLSSNTTMGEASALIDALLADDGSGDVDPNSAAAMRKLVEESQVAAGQQVMPLEEVQ